MLERSVEVRLDDLLEFVEDGKVVPIIGEELLQVRRDGIEFPLYRYIADKLAERLEIPASAVPAEECHLENVASPQEIADGWTIHEDLRVVKQVDSAPYEQGGRGNWFVDREKTTLPLCSVFDDLGAYSLRSYMLQPVVTKVQVKICQATAGGGSVPFVPADAKPQPSDTAHEVFDSYKRPYAGPCPPVRPAPVPVPRSR